MVFPMAVRANQFTFRRFLELALQAKGEHTGFLLRRILVMEVQGRDALVVSAALAHCGPTKRFQDVPFAELLVSPLFPRIVGVVTVIRRSSGGLSPLDAFLWAQIAIRLAKGQEAQSCVSRRGSHIYITNCSAFLPGYRDFISSVRRYGRLLG